MELEDKKEMISRRILTGLSTSMYTVFRSTVIYSAKRCQLCVVRLWYVRS
jgi:hypothetical protein